MAGEATLYFILEGWPAARQIEFVRRFATKDFHDGEVVLEKGDVDTAAYFIAEGAIKVINFGPEGHTSFFATLGKGECFGYYASISHEPRTATIIAVGETRLIKVPAKDFVELVTTNPQIASNFLKELIDILRADTARITSLTTLPAPERVIAQLLAEQAQQKTSTITMPNRVEWAGSLSMSRETLSRVLNELVDQGLIGIEGNRICIRDEARLGERLG